MRHVARVAWSQREISLGLYNVRASIICLLIEAISSADLAPLNCKRVAVWTRSQCARKSRAQICFSFDIIFIRLFLLIARLNILWKEKTFSYGRVLFSFIDLHRNCLILSRGNKTASVCEMHRVKRLANRRLPAFPFPGPAGMPCKVARSLFQLMARFWIVS